MQKTGQIERTVDREFADEEAKFKTYVPCLASRMVLAPGTHQLVRLQIREGMPDITESSKRLLGRDERCVDPSLSPTAPLPRALSVTPP